MNNNALKTAVKLITITIVTTGVILATLRSIKIDVIPNTQIVFKDFSDIVLYVNDSASGDVVIQAQQMGLLHYDTTTKKFYKSSTANMENLTEIESTGEVVNNPLRVKTNKGTGGYLYINAFTATGSDAINGAIRALIRDGNGNAPA